MLPPPPTEHEIAVARANLAALRANGSPLGAIAEADYYTANFLKRGLYALGDIIVALPGWPRGTMPKGQVETR
jgi:hypothetical protein